jgi:peptidyl-dipeptidase Dcp
LDAEDDTREVQKNVDCVCKANLMGKRILPNGKFKIKWHKHQESHEFISKIAAPVSTVKVEAKEIQNLIDGQNGGFKLEPWNFTQRAST